MKHPSLIWTYRVENHTGSNVSTLDTLQSRLDTRWNAEKKHCEEIQNVCKPEAASSGPTEMLRISEDSRAQKDTGRHNDPNAMVNNLGEGGARDVRK